MNKRVLLVLAASVACLTLALPSGCGGKPKPQIDWKRLHDRFRLESLAVPPNTRFAGWMEGAVAGGPDVVEHGSAAFLLNIRGLITAHMLESRMQSLWAAYERASRDIEVTNLQDDVIRYYLGVLNECGIDVKWTEQESAGGLQLHGRFRRFKGTNADAVFSTEILLDWERNRETMPDTERIFYMAVRLSVIPH